MAAKQFWLGLGLSILGSAALIGLIVFFVPSLATHSGFAALSIGLFTLITIATYFAGNAATKNSNKFAFNNLIIISVFSKMVLSLLILFLYKKAAQPTEGWFAVFFLLIYAIFTSYEVLFLTRQAKM